MKRYAICFLLMVAFSVVGQDNTNYRIAFYNVENLFHPDNDSLTRDDEFTPEGQRYWNFYKYREKYHRMAKAILSIGGDIPADVVGLAEVENRQVIIDMVNSAVLQKAGYEVIHKNSPDRRGIDVAAIYRPERLNLLDTIFIKLKMPGDPDFASRDMLYLKFELKATGDTLHLVYCHWPSRYGGQAVSEPKRIQAARTLKKLYDSLYAQNPQLYFMAAGDFNDEWHNASMSEYLEAQNPKQAQAGQAGLFNLMAAMDPLTGSHRYQGEWTYLDQIIVNDKLLNSNELKIEQAAVLNHAFLLEKDGKYPGEKPFRTFIGFKYHGGFSDHLPVFIDLAKN